MKTRLVTAAVLVFIAVIILIFSYIPLVMNGIIAIITAGGVYELLTVTKTVVNKRPAILIGTIFGVGAFVGVPYFKYALPVFYFYTLGIFLYLMINAKKLNRVNKFLCISMLFCMPMLFYSVPYLRFSEKGLVVLFIAALVGVITDTGAYFVGRAMGAHKLAPFLSPKKTVEGAVGGTIISMIAVLGTSLVINRVGNITVDVLGISVYSFIASIIGQFGDLSLSSVKRIMKVKDYGTIFPGHGGFLDRFDSLMFVIPFTYLFCEFIKPILI